MYNNPDLIKTFLSEAAITKHRIVKWGTGDGKVVQAAASTDKLVGVSGNLGVDASAKSIDIILTGVSEIEYGGNVTRGDELTSDANGKAITAAPTAGNNMRTIGVAMCSGVSGDIGSVRIAPGTVQG